MNKILWTIALILLLTACNSGSNSDDKSIVGLSLPAKIEAIPATQSKSNSVNVIKTLSAILPAAYSDPSTDFSTDKPQSYVYDDSVLYTYIANYLLCFVNKLDYQSMVNKGPYLAAVNFQKCYEESFPNTNINFPNPIYEATVISSRKDNRSPHIVKAWFSLAGAQDSAAQSGMIAEQTLLEITINQTPGENNPFGDFSINISDVQDASLTGGSKGLEQPVYFGKYQAGLNHRGAPALRFIGVDDASVSSSSQGYQAFTIALSGNNQRTGAIHTQGGDSETSIQSSSYIDYNFNRVLKGEYNLSNQNFDTQTCLARDETRTQLFGYNLYFKNDGVFRGNSVSAGQRVELNTGFSFLYNGQSGWMDEDYYWMENDTKLPNGAMITKQSYLSTNQQQQQFTVMVSPGKFTGYQNVEEPVSSLQGVDLVYWGTHPDSSVIGNWIVNVTANNDFEIVKQRVWTGTEYIESDTYDDDKDPTTPEVPVLATMVLPDGQSIDYSDKSYSKNYRYTYDSTVLAENRTVTLRLQHSESVTDNTLFPQGVTQATLYCYERCLKGGLTQEMVNGATSSSDALYYNILFSATATTYTAKLNNYQISLIDDTNGLPVDASNLDLTPMGSYSLNSGKLVPQPLVQPTNFFQLDNAPTSYTWTTGGGSYNSSVALLDQNNALFTFDKPLNIAYIYDASDDLYNTDPVTNPNQGKTFTLTYSTAGSLWGLPYTIDATGRYFPEVNLAPGTSLSNNEGDYVLKASWEMQTLSAKDLTECASLSVEALVANPDIALLSSADITPVSFTVADKPVVEGEPVVTPEF